MVITSLELAVTNREFVISVKGEPDVYIRSFYEPPRFVKGLGGRAIIVSATRGLLGLDVRGNLKPFPRIEISDGDPRVLLTNNKHFVVSNGWQRISRFDRSLDGKSILSELRRTRRVFVIDGNTWDMRLLGSAVQLGIPVKVTDKVIYTFYTPFLEKWITGSKVPSRFTIKAFDLKSMKELKEHPLKHVGGDLNKFRFSLWLGNEYLQPKWQGSESITLLGAKFRVER
jgi:hypothetical protein